jgi:uncharacterized protein with NRDE domain
MCTVILALGVHPDVPLIVAANRDEFLDRPSAPPRPLGRGLFGPSDLRAGGTWMAINDRGVFATLTNAVPPDLAGTQGKASRGEVPTQVLQASTAAEAAEIASTFEPGRTLPYYLLVADRERAYGVLVDEDRNETVRLEAGVHVQENRVLDDPESEKVTRVNELVDDLSTWPVDALVPRLHAVLGDHDPRFPPLRRLCVHVQGYGTRSSSILLYGGDDPDADPRWWFSEGNPCEGSPRLSR